MEVFFDSNGIEKNAILVTVCFKVKEQLEQGGVQGKNRPYPMGVPNTLERAKKVWQSMEEGDVDLCHAWDGLEILWL